MSRAPALPHEKIQALSTALSSAQVPHAFGGAIALLYCGEPRGTIDIDVNLFVGESEAASILPLLENLGVSVDRTSALQAITRDGQVRLDWAGTPLDLFFSYDALHDSWLVAGRDSFDSGYVRSWLSRVIGPDDPRSQAFEALLEETRSS